MEKYKRIQLIVEAIFDRDGNMQPIRIHCGDEVFAINRILSVGRHCPSTVRAIAPVEYRIDVEGTEKKIYYEADSNTWFSVRACGNE